MPPSPPAASLPKPKAESGRAGTVRRRPVTRTPLPARAVGRFACGNRSPFAASRDYPTPPARCWAASKLAWHNPLVGAGAGSNTTPARPHGRPRRRQGRQRAHRRTASKRPHRRRQGGSGVRFAPRRRPPITVPAPVFPVASGVPTGYRAAAAPGRRARPGPR